MKISIKSLKELSQQYNLDHIIVFATEGKEQFIATFGRNLQECDEAAQFGDKLKDTMGWPESLHASPSRVKALQKENKELKEKLSYYENKGE